MSTVFYDPVADNFHGLVNAVDTIFPLVRNTEITFTTTGNIDNLDFSNASLIRMNNASDATIRGLLAGTPGQVVIIMSKGAGNVYLAHQNTNSSAANRLINFATIGNTPIAAGIGAAIYQYDGTTDRWKLVSHNQGALIDVPFNAGDFTADVGSAWTLQSTDMRQFAYLLVGKTLILFVSLADTTVATTTTANLFILIPNSFQAFASYVSQVGALFAGLSNAVAVNFYPRVTASTPTLVRLNRADGVNWAIGTNNNDSSFQFQFAVD